jgi:oligopeptide transport system permease protein
MRLLPVEGYFGERFDKLDEIQKELILEKFGLLDPWYKQLTGFYKNLAKGDLGTSIIYRVNVPVTEVIAPRIPYSLRFGVLATLISIVLGVLMGINMATYKGGLRDKIWTGYIIFVSAVPSAVYLLFVQLYGSSLLSVPILFDKFRPQSWILPIISLSLAGIAFNAMWMRRFMVDELNKDYIRLALAKGLPYKAVLKKHVMRNAYVPLAQYLPATLLSTIAGSIYIESLYSIPGMGGLLVDVISRQDNPMVQGLVLLFSSIGIIGLFLGDILMGVIDPRIKLSKGDSSR